ncbi:MAG TPA: hypothetical protein VJ576_17395 [Rhodocyclaceae bacterium]|nr:hypothetical protein [Rhodocyclaceae bacterium]
MLKTYIFFLPDSGKLEPVPQDEYVRPVRGERPMATYAGRRIRVADWYVKVSEGAPTEVENETYTFLEFDQEGRVALHGLPGDEACAWPRGREDTAAGEPSGQGSSPQEGRWLPTEEERERIRNMIFGSVGR